MKIFLIASIGQFAVGDSFFRAFSSLGHQVMVLNQLNYFPIQSHLPGRIKNRLTRKINLVAYNRNIRRYALQFKPDLLVVTKGVNIFPDTLRIMKDSLPRLQLININYDDFFSSAPSNVFSRLNEVVSLYDWIFPSKKANVVDLRDLGCRNVHYIPIGYDPHVHFPVFPDPDEYRRFYCEVLFVGTFTPERAAFLHSLTEFQLGIWGGAWKLWQISPFLRRSIARSGKNRNVGGLKFAKVVASCRIALNFFREENKDTHNHRTFELPACGVFTLSQRSEELGKFFEEDKEIAVFSSPDELRDKVKYYLEHPREREKMAHLAHERLKKGKHTIRDRVRTILNVIEQGRCK